MINKLLVILTDAAYYIGGVSKEDLFSSSRKRHACMVRNICMRVLAEEGYSACEIGRLFNRTHGAVFHALKTYENDWCYCPEFRKLCDDMRDFIDSQSKKQ